VELTVIIPYYNGGSSITKLLNSLPVDLPIIIIDDQSAKPLALASDDINLKVIRPDRKGYFSGAVNRGISECNTDVLVLNQDVLFEGTDWLDIIIENRDEYAMIGERIKGNHPAYPNGYIHGTFMFIRRDAWKKVGKLNQTDYPLWGSTCEWQLRACRKGFKVLPLEEIPGFAHSRSGRYGDAISQILREEPDRKNLLIRTPPLISVVVPCYNYGKYLPDLINSFIGGHTCLGQMPGQTLQSFEIIIADDGSTDGETQEIGESLHDPWKGVFYYRCPINGGTAYAANYAIEHSNAPYITRMDADDMRDSTSLEALYRTLIKDPHSFTYDDIILFTNGKRKKKVWKFQEYNFDELIWKNHVHAGIMFPYSAWKETGGYPEVMSDGRDDWAFNVALGVKGYCGIRVANPGYLYRREGQNRTLTNTTPVRRAEFLEKIKRLFPNIYRGERPMGCCGNRKSGVSPSAGAKNMGTYVGPPSLPGASGMIQVEYQGGNYGLQTFYGPATGTAYTFSVKHKRRNIDVRDAHFPHASTQKDIGLLGLHEAGKSIFLQVQKPVAKKPAPVKPAPVKPPPEPKPEPEPEIVIEVEGEELEFETPVAVPTQIEQAGFSEKDLEALIEANYGLKKIIESTNKGMQKDLGWGYGRVKKVKDIAKEFISDVEP